MRRLVIYALSLSITFALAAGCSSTQKGPRESVKPTPANISGAWASACTDPGNGQAFLLMFDLTETTWALDYEAFSDAACAVPSITVHIEGGYELGVASTAVPGGREGRFDFGKKTVKPHTAGAAGFLAQACGREGFAAGTAYDISAGCPGLGAYPMSACPSDHDVVLLDEQGKLHFGLRPQDNNMCTPDKRPTARGPTLSRR